MANSSVDFFNELSGTNEPNVVNGEVSSNASDFFDNLGPSPISEEKKAPTSSGYTFPSKDSLYHKFFGEKDEVNPESEEATNPIRSKIRNALQSAGWAKVVTWPADVIKTLGVADALQELEELKERGFDIDEEKYMQALQSAADIFPTQDLVEQLAEEHLGIPFEPKTAKQKQIRTAAEFMGFFAKSHLKDITKKPPIEPTELSQIGQKYKLRPVAATEIKEPKGKTPVVTPGRAKSIKQEINTQVEALSKAVIKKQIPAAQARALGVDLEAAYEEYVGTALKRAENSTKKVSLDPVVKNIDNRISELKATAPNPDEFTKRKIELLKDLKKGFLEEVPASKLLSPSGKPVTAAHTKPKEFSPKETINQFRAHNKNVNASYKKTNMTGLEEAEAEVYAFVNDELVGALEKATGNEISLPFRMSNEMFSQTKNLEKVESLIERAMEKPSGLQDLMRSPKGIDVQKAIGETGANQLKEMGKYQSEVAKRLDTMVSKREVELSNLTSFRRLIKEGTTILPRIAGYRYTSKNLGNNYIRAQKLFLQKKYAEAEKLAEEIISNLPD
jgi:hypothetical protein